MTSVISNQANPGDGPATRKSRLAIAAMILGLAALIPLLGVPFAFAAIVCAIMALVKLSGPPRFLTGKGFAITGLIAGILGLIGNIMLIVIVAVLVPTFAAHENGARIHAAKAQVSLFEAALVTYEADLADFPSTEQGLEALVVPPEGAKDWSGPYLKMIPLDPWGHPYQYLYPGVHGKIDVWSFGPDGIDGTADDIGNWMK